jgi:hypothetical protein
MPATRRSSMRWPCSSSSRSSGRRPWRTPRRS